MPRKSSSPKLTRQDKARITRLSRDVEKARGTVAKEARAKLRQATREIKAAAREAERYNKQQQKIALKKFRHEWSILRRKGVVKADARSVKMSARNIKTVAEYQHVLSGKEKTFRIKNKADLTSLRAQGVRVRNGTAIVSKDFNVRNGKVFSVKKKGRRIYTISPESLGREDIEKAVRDAYRRLKPRYGLAFRFQGYGSYQIYQDADLMIQDLLVSYYKDRENFYPVLEFFDPKEDFEAYNRKRVREQFERQMSRDMSRKERAKARRAARRLLKSMVSKP